MTEFIQFITTHWISILGTMIGLLYLFFEYKASVWMWPASVVMTVLYIYIYYTSHLFASMGINIYFFFASVYAWIVWALHVKKTGNKIALFDRKYIAVVLVAILVVFIIIWLILRRFSDEGYYLGMGDALTTSLNLVSLWMTSRRWAEQWLLLVPANAISAVLLYVQGDPVSTGLYIVYTVASVAGYISWKKMRQRQFS